MNQILANSSSSSRGIVILAQQCSSLFEFTLIESFLSPHKKSSFIASSINLIKALLYKGDSLLHPDIWSYDGENSTKKATKAIQSQN